MNFQDLNVDKKLVDILEGQGINQPSPVQEQAIPLLKKNKSALIKAPTGSGKTLAYLIPLLENLEEGKNFTQEIIIVPTSILALQVNKNLSQFKKIYKDFTSVIISSTAIKEDKFNEDIIVATPDQFIKRLSQFNLKYVNNLIIDEGDMILFGGFEEQLNSILGLDIKANKYLFTASVDEHLNRLVRRYIGADTLLDLSNNEINASNISHYLVDIKHVPIGQALVNFLKNLNYDEKIMAFVSKKSEIGEVSEVLNKNKINHLVISGEMNKRDQRKAYKDFEEGKSNLLLCTDIAARGVDIKDVTTVISLNLPYDIIYYFHRAGRAGRFYKKGVSYVFYSNDDTSRSRELINRGVDFTFMSLRNSQLKEERNLSKIEKKPQKNNIYLEKAIKQKLRKLRGNEVKPNYKKKRRKAIQLVKQRHKDEIIKKNLDQRNTNEGTHYSFVSYKEPNVRKSKKKRGN